MIKPDKDRLNYSEMLKPPAGYEVSFAIGTTYSLDLEALIGVPLALSLSEEMDDTLQKDPIYMLEGLRRSADQMVIFCEAGQIKVPQKENSLFALMEDSVFEVALENEMSFHPKIWLIKYENSDNHFLYRLLVLTRNLTFDRSWDLALAVEGEMYEEVSDKNQPLIDFIKFLTPYTMSKEKKEHIDKIINELPYIHFDSGNKYIPDFEFHPLGIEGYDSEKSGIFEDYHEKIVISPFISKEVINELGNKSLSSSKKVLITRRLELQKLTKEILKIFDVYVLKDIILEGEDAVSEDDAKLKIPQLQDIHAKFYARTKKNQHHIYIGSANSSRNAFNGNIEFLLKLQYKKYGFKLTSLLDNLFGEDDRDNPFEKIEELPKDDMEEKDDISDRLQRVIKQLVRIRSSASVQKKKDTYSLHLSFNAIPSKYSILIGPLLSEKMIFIQEETMFKDLTILELGEFYKVKVEGDGESIVRIIKIPTIGLPPERHREIYRSTIKNSYSFLQYIAFLLADDFLLSAVEQIEQKGQGALNWDLKAGNYPILYENMLQAAARAPEKLKDIDHVIQLIDDREIIPNEFYRLYETFNEAVKMVNE
ncbi:phospholipase D family protein [Alkalicoccus luteus]|uniref:phospholipase D family protein n=1 Tax=Alkalicoccus luteus TaxID=1237094 RepID=UPI00403444D2